MFHEIHIFCLASVPSNWSIITHLSLAYCMLHWASLKEGYNCKYSPLHNFYLERLHVIMCQSQACIGLMLLALGQYLPGSGALWHVCRGTFSIFNQIFLKRLQKLPLSHEGKTVSVWWMNELCYFGWLVQSAASCFASWYNEQWS